MDGNSKWKQFLRWVSVLPASLIAGVIAHSIWRLLHLVTAARYIPTDSWLNVIFMEVVSNLVMGFTIVYVAAYIAPRHKRVAAVSMAGLLLIISGVSLLATFLTGKYLTLISIVFLNVGSVVTTLNVFQGRFKSLG